MPAAQQQQSPIFVVATIVFASGLLCLFGLPKQAAAVERWSMRLAATPPPQTDDQPVVQVGWRGVGLSRALENLQQATGSQVFVDRRIDPSTPLTLRATGTAAELLEAITRQTPAQLSALAGVYYLGPPEAARDLATLHARARLEVDRLPRGARRVFHQARPIAWQRLATPAGLLGQALSASGLKVANPEALPHDLWPPGRLPAAPLSEQLTLLLAGFDLEWRPTPTGDAIRLAPVKTPIALTLLHTPGASVDLTTEQFLTRAPEAKALVKDGVWAVQGRLEHHALLESLFRGEKPAIGSSRQIDSFDSPPAIADQRFSLTVKQQTAGAVLRQVARSLSLELKDETDGRWVGERVSFEVRQATLSELLESLGRESGVDIHSSNGRIVVRDR